MSWPSSSKAAGRLKRARTATRVQKQLQRRHPPSRPVNELQRTRAPFTKNLFILTILHLAAACATARSGPFQRDSRIFHGSLIHHRFFFDLDGTLLPMDTDVFMKRY